MSGITNIYDPASQIEAAIAAILTVGGLVATTPATAAQFQKARPRVDIVMDVGAEKQSYHTFTDGSQRNATWDGQLSITIIAPSGTAEDGTSVHRLYQATVAYFMDVMPSLLNGNNPDGAPYLPYHKVQRITGTSFVPTYKFEEGVIASKPIYSFEFGVDGAAWAEIGLTRAA